MTTQDLISFTGWLLAVLFSGYSIYTFIKSREEKEPRCCYKTYRNLVKLSEDNALLITYQGIPVDQVSTTYIFFWNKGRKPILRSDVQKQLSIYFPSEVTILDYKVINVTRLEIDFSISNLATKEELEFVPRLPKERTPVKIANRLDICFEFLDKNDGVVIEVKHTGSPEVKLEIEGTILSVPKGIECKEIKQEILYRPPFNTRKELQIFGGFIILAFIPVIIFFGELFFLYGYVGHNPFQAEYPIKGLFVGFLLLIVMYLLFRLGRKLFYSPFGQSLPFPKSLDTRVNIAPYSNK